MTSFDDLLFVARRDRSNIEIYHIPIFEPAASVSVNGLGSRITGLASCAASRCIFVADWDKRTVHRRDFRVDNSSGTISNSGKWRVDGRPQGLSVARLTGNLIVTCSEGKLLEYTGVGSLVREIVLQSDVAHPWHAIQLNQYGQLAVSHGRYVDGPARSRVSCVNTDGQTLTSRVNKPGPALLACLSYDETGRRVVLVANRDQNKISLWNPWLRKSGSLSVPVVGGLQGPHAIHLDESRDRLYVGEWNSGRVLVIDNVKLACAAALNMV